MSLDVYLEMPGAETQRVGSGIYIREAGRTREISMAEWMERNPNREPATVQSEHSGQVYWANITHNLGLMASRAGIYEPLWEPDEIGITRAAQLIEPLHRGLQILRADPESFRQLNPSNGWGDYEGLVEFVESYLEACRRYPNAAVRACR